MAINYPGPYEVRIYYTVNTLVHSQRLNCRLASAPSPGDAFDDIDVLRRDDSPFSLKDEVDDWVALMLPLFSTAAPSTIDYAELWAYEAESFDASFVSTYPIALTGTSGSSYQPASQYIITFRTEEGGIMKLSFMETIVVPGIRDTLPLASVAGDAIADAIVAGTVPWLARDTSYPFACIAAYPGQSEAVFKKRFRP